MANKKIDLNTASVKMLADIQGVSVKLAEKILTGRPYDDIAELKNISGIGKKTFENLSSSTEVVKNNRESKDVAREYLVKRPDVVLLRFRAEDHGGVSLVVPDHGIDIPFSEPFKSNRLQMLSDLEGSVVPSQYDPKLHAEVGKVITRSLLKTETNAGSQLLSVMGKAAQSAAGYGLPWTLQLVFDEAAFSSAQIPWELWHDGSGHALAQEELRLNRYITYFGEREPYEKVESLRVLYLESRPRDAGNLPDLTAAYKKSTKRLGSRIQTDFIQNATFEAFSTAMTNGDYHIVHFDGHGSSDRVSGVGFLLFEDSSGNTDYVPSDKISAVLKDSGVRLVVLAACQGSSIGGGGMFKSTAPALIRAGIPAVIANQFTIFVDAIIEFSGEFYASLARGESLSAAVADGRKSMAKRRGQFFLPTLYMRVADGEGYLFSGEPESHREWRLGQLASLALWWQGLSELQQYRYIEGEPRWHIPDTHNPKISEPREQKFEEPITKKPSENTIESVEPKKEDIDTEGGSNIGNVSGIYERLGIWWHPERYWVPHPPEGVGEFDPFTFARRIRVQETGNSLSISLVPDPFALKYSGGGEYDMDFSESLTVTGESNRKWFRLFRGWEEYEMFVTTDLGATERVMERGENSFFRFEISPGPYLNWWENEVDEQKRYYDHFLDGVEELKKGMEFDGLPRFFQEFELMIPTPADDLPLGLILNFYQGGTNQKGRYIRISKSG
jgi:hypothetical protein